MKKKVKKTVSKAQNYRLAEIKFTARVIKNDGSAVDNFFINQLKRLEENLKNL